MAHSNLIRCCIGSIAVEIAVIIPIMVLILLATYDLVRIIQLSNRAEAAAHLAADNLSRSDILNEETIQETAFAVQQMLDEQFQTAQMFLSVTAIEVHGRMSQKILWSRSVPAGAALCTSAPYPFAQTMAEAEDAADIQFFYQLDVCLVAEEVTFSSGLPFLEQLVRGSAILLSASPAIREIET